MQQQQRQKHYKRRKIPAVLLIQNLWRVYAADEKSLSKATWKVHVRPLRKETDAAFQSRGTHQSQYVHFSMDRRLSLEISHLSISLVHLKRATIIRFSIESVSVVELPLETRRPLKSIMRTPMQVSNQLHMQR